MRWMSMKFRSKRSYRTTKSACWILDWYRGVITPYQTNDGLTSSWLVLVKVLWLRSQMSTLGQLREWDAELCKAVYLEVLQLLKIVWIRLCSKVHSLLRALGPLYLYLVCSLKNTLNWTLQTLSKLVWMKTGEPMLNTTLSETAI